ncbi:hypothetical protein PACTADRAFT_66918 [Pachysolen tannophilus NRRL Y-2460]|uniref:Uncharacterized protein n=1 Tax=Pachysolen tannophilus NRRL Y-2460 TaxID=669874 RepID=A0A1E4TW12_PACTA|nr:hypothetical protein PACTADRAFT_66918 [Pachysolen tannophilus NRRL Y-2460]
MWEKKNFWKSKIINQPLVKEKKAHLQYQDPISNTQDTFVIFYSVPLSFISFSLKSNNNK